LLASWAYPVNIVQLSFDLHEQLAEEHDGAHQWGYRRVRCGQLTATALDDRTPKHDSWSNASILLGKWRRGDRAGAKPSVLPCDLDWFAPETAKAYEEIADDRTTAQVHPLQFTNAMARLSEEAGAKIVLGTVTDINCTVRDDAANAEGNEDTPTIVSLSSFAGPTQKVVSVTYTDKASGETKIIPADTIVIAAGPWTPTLLPDVPMASLRAHSVTIRPKRPVSAYCLFTEITLPDHTQPTTDATKSPRSQAGTATAPRTRTLSPELYARPNNEVYICGRGDVDSALPASSDLVEVSSAACAELVAAASAVSDELRDGIVTGRRACYLPTMDVGGSGGPLIGGTDVEGLILAAGHSCWGILNAPATGKVVSELILDGEVRCADVSSLDPKKIL
jgi:glycine/D-amino acid oxidase-like deaminating enzyme